MTFIEAFRARVDLQPEAPAIVLDGRVALTYRGLENAARSLSNLLTDRGAGAETLIALDLPKSPDLVVAMLGCWGAGAAFLPLDPQLPAARREFMLHDSGAKPLTCPTHFSGPLVSEPLAYVIYTSGSSGIPKGVAVTHAGIMNLLEAQVKAFRLHARSRALWFLSPAFDASISDVGTVLLSGGALYIEDVPPSGLLARMEERGITHADLPPALLAVLDPADCPASLETVVIGGEVCPPEAVRGWARQVRVVNVYGPTEATVCASLSVCDAETWSRPLIGHPLPNVTFPLLAPGPAAELYIGGCGVARGYVNRPDLTAERFVLLDGKRVYRTGDRVMQHDNGEIEFLGRVDRQVKLRGRLVRPEEIEARLQQHRSVARAAVKAGSRFLTAFVQSSAPFAELESYLAEFLPPWMIPRRWMRLDAMPLTPSGKVELSALVFTRASRTSRPATVREATLAQVWRSVLELEEVGPEDDFFDLGGDSLAVIEMLVAAQAQGVVLTPGQVYTLRTIEALARSETGSDVMSAEVLRADVAQSDAFDVTCGGQVARGPFQHVLLTGATGFLGSHLLPELLRRCDADVTCLVRESHPDSPRVTYLRGDLSAPRLGLSPSAWDRLVATIDTIFHCGAAVHLLHSYSVLRPTNVGGTIEIARLMAEGRPKRLHFASTLSVFVATDRNCGRCFEADTLDDTRAIFGGYAQSKWAAEVYLRRWAGVLGPVGFYRFGLLTGGCFPPHDWLSLFVRGIASLGCVPDTALDREVDLTPVDYAAAALAYLSTGPEGTFHIANPQATRGAALVDAVRRSGRPIEVVDAQTWQARVAAGGSTASAAVATLSSSRTLDLFQATAMTFDQRNTARGLQGSGLSCPAPTPPVIDRYVASILDSSVKA